jgi:citrate lyase subunit beta / citryl-CoA lyase
MGGRVIATAADKPGAFQFDGKMVDAPIIARARKLLES